MAKYRIASIKDTKVGYNVAGEITYVDVPFGNSFTMSTNVQNITYEGDNETEEIFMSADLSGRFTADKWSDDVIEAIFGKTGVEYAVDEVAAVTVTNGGTGYTSAPAIGTSGGGGSGATFSSVRSGGVITAINVVTPGSGFMSAPSITISGGAGSGAAATSSLGTLPDGTAKRIYFGDNAEFTPAYVEIVVTAAAIQEDVTPEVGRDIRITIFKARAQPFKAGDLGNRTKQVFEIDWAAKKTETDIVGAALPGVPSGGATYAVDFMRTVS
jgi:hypothetical protein